MQKIGSLRCHNLQLKFAMVPSRKKCIHVHLRFCMDADDVSFATTADTMILNNRRLKECKWRRRRGQQQQTRNKSNASS